MDKNKPMMMIIIALLVLLLGTVVAVTFYLISAFGGEGEAEAPVPERRNIMPNQIEWRELEEIRTNLLDPPPGRQSAFIITTLIVGVNATVSNRELSDFDLAWSYSVARMIANEVLYSTTYTEARTPEGRAAIEELILARLQLQFGPMVVRVGASDWAVT